MHTTHTYYHTPSGHLTRVDNVKKNRTATNDGGDDDDHYRVRARGVDNRPSAHPATAGGWSAEKA